MFALGLRYLNGWSMAAAGGAQKEQVEWPPHPDRVFMALAAAWFETGEDTDEGDALRWLERLNPPAIAASDASQRTSVVSYVPVNDTQRSRSAILPDLSKLKGFKRKHDKLKEAGLALLPEHRERRARRFPVAIPRDPTVHLIWSEALEGYGNALRSLATKVTHVGHAACFVQVWIEHCADIPATWAPTEGIANLRLRVPSAGRLARLAQIANRDSWIAYHDLSYEIDRAKSELKAMKQPLDNGKHPRTPRAQNRHITDLTARLKERFPDGMPRAPMRPVPVKWQSYARPKKSTPDFTPGSVFDPHIVVLTIEGHRVSLSATLKLTAALRGLLMRECPVQPPPEWFSGHDARGRPATAPHLALASLPFVGAEHADGQVMGMALVLPRTLEPRDAGVLLGPILQAADTGLPREHLLFDGAWFECRLVLDTRERPPINLQPLTWTAPSRTWASVSPVVLNRHFDGGDRWERAAESVKDACEHIDLPRPSEVLLHPVSLIAGVPRAGEFPRLTRKRDGGRQSHAHAVMIFDEPVAGPVLVGAGRFRGYGLCRPMNR
ncbi:MAG: type I-U CRISPR-associated protein Cas5/Cas6 [Gammaproteobacteria bacterium]|nr:type I-U CRISPR-associated protein Cas5/Cas6 [Gammaproteobacteria bacterium]MYB76777.1 type I-U CRISPR-associated protein Cas5/Cas6 [Chloroflexota bacterium]